jgi:hypothetical protein
MKSMDQEPKPEFKIERIIALKRYEQPPPGYFHLLPDRIIHRIEHGEGRSTFWERWWPSIRVRPGLAYSLGLAVCGTLTIAVYCAPKNDMAAAMRESPPGSQWAAVADESASPPDTALSGSRWLGSTNPVMAPRSGDLLFKNTEARAIPVSLFQPN